MRRVFSKRAGSQIIVYLLDATLPFRGVWVGEFFSELATVIFFCLTGYMFKPAERNEYFEMSNDDYDDDAYAGGSTNKRGTPMKGFDV